MQSLAVQADGKILVGGGFTTLGGQTRTNLGRLNATDPATQSLSFDGSTITWLRGGTSPEVWRTTFDWSSDGLLWTPVGDGTRIPGGWQPTNAVVPVNATIRARGFVTGGRYNGSGWFVEDYLGLGWVAQPQSRTNDAGTTAAFGAVAGGMPPLSYQWYKDGAALADGSHIAGATTASLTLTNVLGADAGGYWLVVSNAYGARTSVVATLTVNDPVITVPPLSQNRELGEDATLSVTALGTAPLGYQWWKDGAALTGRTAASLTLTNSLATDAGSYWVAVTSPYGSVTSQVALLTVNQATADPGFNPEADGDVFSLAVQADGKILVGGLFSTLGGQACNYLAGSTRTARWTPASIQGRMSGVDSLAVQADGKILVGGSFSTLGGQTRNYLGRLNPDGTLDTGFNPGADVSMCIPWRCRRTGRFWWADSSPRWAGRPAITLAGSTPTARWTPGSTRVRITVCIPWRCRRTGRFWWAVSSPRWAGRRATTLAGSTRTARWTPRSIRGLAVVHSPMWMPWRCRRTGRFWWAVISPRWAGRPAIALAGSTPTARWTPGSTRGRMTMWIPWRCRRTGRSWWADISPRWAGRPAIALAGSTRMARWTPGSTRVRMTVWNPWRCRRTGRFWWAVISPRWAGRRNNYLGRLNATDPATQSLSCDGSAITWLRGGTSPEVWRTTFDWSSDGLLWTPLGEGTRIPGGWQPTNALVPVDATIRARGFVTGGEYNGSGWFVETLATNRSLTLQLSGVWRLNDGNIRLTGSGPSGAPYRVLAATNLDLPLGNWLQIGSGTFTGGLLDFADLQATNYPCRFYRTITP